MQWELKSGSVIDGFAVCGLRCLCFWRPGGAFDARPDETATAVSMDVDFYLGERRFPALLGEESLNTEKD